jgi:hypothetical protein
LLFSDRPDCGGSGGGIGPHSGSTSTGTGTGTGTSTSTSTSTSTVGGSTCDSGDGGRRRGQSDWV